MTATLDEALDLRACCAARAWVDGLLTGRPYADLAAVLATSDALVLTLDDTGLDEALAAHPRIGERAASGGREAEWSRREQSAARTTDPQVQAELRAANAAYEERFDRVFLVFASGKTPEQVLAVARQRLGNDDATERAAVLEELRLIVRLRLERMLGP